MPTRLFNMDLMECRKMINEIDDQMKELFLKRMEVVSNVALYKKENDLYRVYKMLEISTENN